MTSTDNRELKFSNYSIADYLNILKTLLAAGKKNFLIRGIDAKAKQFLAEAKKNSSNFPCNLYLYIDSSSAPFPDKTNSKFKAEGIDAIFVLIKDAALLSSILIKYSNSNCVIIAPITEHYCRNRPAFVNSIPKSGVHMLFELMRAFDYSEPKILDYLPSYHDDFLSHTFYNLQHMTLDHLLLPYSQIKKFIDSFSNSVVIFMVRDPRDIAVSLAHYIGSLQDYHILRQYFSKLNTEEKITSVIKGEYPIPIYINRKFSFSGNIRDLLMRYANWIKYPLSNVIFLRYEDLVGAKGGGSEQAQLKCIWHLQLALHVAGRPLDYEPKIYNKKTNTFRKGQISNYQLEFSEKHNKLFGELTQDFMNLYGYGENVEDSDVLKETDFKGCMPLDIKKEFLQPVLVEEDYKGFNIVFYGGRFYSLLKALGRIDFIENNVEELSKVKKGIYITNTIEEARSKIDTVANESLAYDKTALFDEKVANLDKEFTDKLKEGFDASRQLISDLKENLKQKAESLSGLKSETNKLREEFNLSSQLISDLKENLKLKEQNINLLNDKILQYDQIIENLYGESKLRDKKISSLQKDISLKEETINLLKNEILRIAKTELLDNRRGYNIVRRGYLYYGILMALGTVDLNDEEQRRHPSIICADSLKELEMLIDKADPSPYIPQIIEDYKEYNLIAYLKKIFAIPQFLGPVNMHEPSQLNNLFIISSESKEEIKEKIDKLAQSISIEYGGILGSFSRFGNCGFHPQFVHMSEPPSGYKFIYPESFRNDLIGKKYLTRKLLFLKHSCFIFISILKFIFLASAKNASLSCILRFLKSRDIKMQFLFSKKQNLVFLPSVPFTLGQYPWVIEIEDTTSLLFPFMHNGKTSDIQISKFPYLPIFKALLESKNCRAIITHVKSTAENLPKLFGSKKLADKTTYIPLGIKLPAAINKNKGENTDIKILFSNSWHQNPDSFFLRGGLDVLCAFKELQMRYPNVYLILRTPLPNLEKQYQDIVYSSKVKLISHFLPKDRWETLINESDIFVLPSARIHAVSTLEAMSYGLAVVVSDGWAIEEYVQHGKNGMVIKGRYGKVTWMDEKTGMLREDYAPMFYQDTQVTKRLIEALSSLIEDKELRNRIGQQARRDIETEYSLEKWNKGLKKAFDMALSKTKYI